MLNWMTEGREGGGEGTSVEDRLIKPFTQDELLRRMGAATRERRGTGADEASETASEAGADEQDELRVLLAEDDTVNQKLATQLLEKKGHEVVVADTGREATEAFEAGTYDLILMDMQMPEMGGLEATRWIREHETKTGEDPVPIVALTARATEVDRERCLEAGMDSYLSKPMEGEELAELLTELFAEEPSPEA